MWKNAVMADEREGAMIQIDVGKPPRFFWWFVAPGALALLLGLAGYYALAGYSKVLEVQAKEHQVVVAEATAEKSTPSKRTASK
jgi:hypothetical protein